MQRPRGRGSRQGYSTCKGPESGEPEPQPKIREPLWSDMLPGRAEWPLRGLETTWGSPTRTQHRVGLMRSEQAQPMPAAAWRQSGHVRWAGLALMSSSLLMGRKLALVKQRQLSPLFSFTKGIQSREHSENRKELETEKAAPRGARPCTYPGEPGRGSPLRTGVAPCAPRHLPLIITCLGPCPWSLVLEAWPASMWQPGL